MHVNRPTRVTQPQQRKIRQKGIGASEGWSVREDGLYAPLVDRRAWQASAASDWTRGERLARAVHTPRPNPCRAPVYVCGPPVAPCAGSCAVAFLVGPPMTLAGVVVRLRGALGRRRVGRCGPAVLRGDQLWWCRMNPTKLWNKMLPASAPLAPRRPSCGTHSGCRSSRPRSLWSTTTTQSERVRSQDARARRARWRECRFTLRKGRRVQRATRLM